MAERHPPACIAAHLAADGRQLQRPRRGDRLDSIAVQEAPAGDALLRRDPHAALHRLPERTVRDGCWRRRIGIGRAARAGCFTPAGREPLSLFEIAQVINRVGGYDPDLLMGCPRLHAGPIPPRAGNVSMDSSKLARALGYEPFDPWPLDAAHACRPIGCGTIAARQRAGLAGTAVASAFRNPRRSGPVIGHLPSAAARCLR